MTIGAARSLLGFAALLALASSAWAQPAPDPIGAILGAPEAPVTPQAVPAPENNTAPPPAATAELLEDEALESDAEPEPEAPPPAIAASAPVGPALAPPPPVASEALAAPAIPAPSAPVMPTPGPAPSPVSAPAPVPVNPPPAPEVASAPPPPAAPSVASLLEAMVPAPQPAPSVAAPSSQVASAAPAPSAPIAPAPSRASVPVPLAPRPPPATPPGVTSAPAPAYAPYAYPRAPAPAPSDGAYASVPQPYSASPGLPYRGTRRQTGAPVHIDELGKTPEAPPNEREISYEERLRASFASAQGLQGPLDGSWVLSADGGDLYSLELVERSSGILEGAWRDLKRAGALNASGFVDEIQRLGGQLTLRFSPRGAETATVSLVAGVDGRWSGELVDGKQRRAVSLRRN